MTETAGIAAAPTDAERMQAAADLAGSHPSPSAEAMLEKHKIGMLGRVVVILIIAGVIGGFIGFLLCSSDAPAARQSAVSGWRLILGWALFAGGLVGCVVSIVRMARSGAFRRGRSKPLQILTTAQRKSVVRQVQGKEPMVAAQLPVTRHVAGNLAAAGPNPWSSVSVVALLAGNAIRSDDGRPWFYFAVIAVLVTGGGVAGRHQAGRARAFLIGHPAPTSAATDG